jgi:hypothetical protein
MGIGGQSSGDFKLSTSALRILYSVTKDTILSLSADGLTQNNPNVVTTATSTTIPVNVKKGVLGGSCAFTRPDVGPNACGGAVLGPSSAYYANTRPLGLFINDSLGNAYENTPGVASGKAPFLRGGSCGVKLFETQYQTTLSYASGVLGTAHSVDGALPAYQEGQFLYASVNGYLTNQWTDSYEAQWINTLTLGTGALGAVRECDVTRMGVVVAPPDSTTNELFVALYL